MPGSEDQPAEDHPPVAVPQEPGPPTASFAAEEARLAATEEARLHQQGQLEQQVSTLNTITVTSVVSSLLTFFVQEATR